MATKAVKAKAQAAPESEGLVEIPRMDIRTITVTVVSDSPIIVHKFSEKARKMMTDKQGGIPTVREHRDPEAEYEAAMYRDAAGNHCFPGAGFKAAMVNACSFIPGVTKVLARGAFRGGR